MNTERKPCRHPHSLDRYGYGARGLKARARLIMGWKQCKCPKCGLWVVWTKQEDTMKNETELRKCWRAVKRMGGDYCFDEFKRHVERKCTFCHELWTIWQAAKRDAAKTKKGNGHAS